MTTAVQIANFGRPHQITVDESDVRVVNFQAVTFNEQLVLAGRLVRMAERPVRSVTVEEYVSGDFTHRVVLTWDRRGEVRP